MLFEASLEFTANAGILHTLYTNMQQDEMAQTLVTNSRVMQKQTKMGGNAHCTKNCKDYA